MPLECSFKQRHGRQFCVTDCPASAPCGTFEYVRVERPEDVPAADPRAIDVAVLDMNHGWPNLGHDSLVHAIMDSSCETIGALEEAGLRVRVLSFDVRRSGVLPEGPGDRYSLYVGTGGPGHIDPRQNDGVAAFAQGVRENPAWEEPAFRLFDAIRASEDAALLAVCHTFGILCRWSGARPSRCCEVPRRASALASSRTCSPGPPGSTPGSAASPVSWGRAPGCASSRTACSTSSRARVGPRRAVPIGFETLGVGGSPGDAVTMIEFARDREGVMPRMFAVNHHPEIVDRFRQVMILNQKRDRGEVTDEWYRERLDILTRSFPEEDVDQKLHLTSDFTLLGPLRFHLFRQVRKRAESLGRAHGFHESRVLHAVLGEAEAVGRAAEVF